MKKYHGKYRPAIDFLVFISYICLGIPEGIVSL